MLGNKFMTFSILKPGGKCPAVELVVELMSGNVSNIVLRYLERAQNGLISDGFLPMESWVKIIQFLKIKCLVRALMHTYNRNINMYMYMLMHNITYMIIV